MAKSIRQTPLNERYQSPYGEVLEFTSKVDDVLYYYKHHESRTVAGAMRKSDLEQLVKFKCLIKI